MERHLFICKNVHSILGVVVVLDIYNFKIILLAGAK